MNAMIVPGFKNLTTDQKRMLENLRDCLLDLTVWEELGCTADNDDDFHAVAKESRRYEQALRDSGLSHQRVINMTRAICRDIRQNVIYG